MCRFERTPIEQICSDAGHVLCMAKSVRDGKAEIQVWLTIKSPDHIVRLEHLGFEVILDSQSPNLIIGRLLVEMLEALVELASCRAVLNVLIIKIKTVRRTLTSAPKSLNTDHSAGRMPRIEANAIDRAKGRIAPEARPAPSA